GEAVGGRIERVGEAELVAGGRGSGGAERVIGVFGGRQGDSRLGVIGAGGRIVDRDDAACGRTVGGRIDGAGNLRGCETVVLDAEHEGRVGQTVLVGRGDEPEAAAVDVRG